MRSLRSLPLNDQIAVRELALEIMRQHTGADIITMSEAVAQARRSLGL